ncbi:MAG: hypothetical protein WCC36_11025 [Gammaproteobacteria bacterium]
MRVKSRWNAKDKERTPEDVAGALGFIAWRIAGNSVLNLENEDYQTDTQAQRLDVIAELLAFLVHLVDRLAYGKIEEADRQRYIGTLGLRLADTMQDNRIDAQGPGEYRAPFIDLLNERMDTYAELPFADGEPGFGMRRYLGDRVAAAMGPKHNKWITQQIMDIEVPEALETLRKALRNLLPQATAD